MIEVPLYSTSGEQPRKTPSGVLMYLLCTVGLEAHIGLKLNGVPKEGRCFTSEASEGGWCAGYRGGGPV